MDTTVSSKGQVIIPKAVRNSQHWPPGTVLRVEVREGGVLLSAEPLVSHTLPLQAAGCLKQALPATGKATAADDNATLRRRAVHDDKRSHP